VPGELVGFGLPDVVSQQQSSLLSSWLGVKEGLHRCLSKTRPALMRPLSIELRLGSERYVGPQEEFGYL
jgi:hypothetical protein